MGDSSDSTTSEQNPRFTVTARVLHWVMAAMVIAMLLIGVFMVTSITDYRFLVAIHKPLGIAILVLALFRIGWRITHRPPGLPPAMGRAEQLLAKSSEWLMYLLLLCQPLIGWAMVSASGQPIHLFGAFSLPDIAPQSTALFATLHDAHTVAAYVLYGVFLAHLFGVLVNTVVIRNRILDRMAVWPRARKPSS